MGPSGKGRGSIGGVGSWGFLGLVILYSYEIFEVSSVTLGAS